MEESEAVRKLVHRKMKDVTVSSEFRNFFITLMCIVVIIYFFTSKPAYYTEYEKREKVDIKQLYTACLEAVEAGGREVVRVRKLHDIGEKSKGKTREGANDPVTEGDMASHRVMYFGLKEAFPSLNIISEEREVYDEKMFVPKLNKENIREEVQIVGGEIHADRLTIWIDPLDATQEYTENLTKYVTVMIGIAIDGRAIGGFIHKPFTNETIWSWRKQRNSLLGHLHLMDEVELNNRTYHDHEGPRIVVSRSHQGDVLKMAEKFKPPGVVTPAGGAGYKVWELVTGHEDVYIHSSMIKKWDICAGAAILNSLGGRLTDAEGKDIDFKNKWDYKHETGLIAAKYDQPEYVAAIKHLSTLED